MRDVGEPARTQLVGDRHGLSRRSRGEVGTAAVDEAVCVARERSRQRELITDAPDVVDQLSRVTLDPGDEVRVQVAGQHGR